MALVTCAGAAVLEGEVHMPLRGAWFAEVKLDAGAAPAGSVSLVAENGVALTGAITTAGVFLDSVHARLVGGAGGLGKLVSGTWRTAQLRDPLQAVLGAAGETLSTTVDTTLLSTAIPAWTVIQAQTRRALDDLAAAASVATGSDVHWRVLADGTIWIGVETWPSATLPDTDVVLSAHPSEGRYVIGASSPSLAPGVNLDGVGNVASVVHWISPDRIRSWASV